MTNVIDITTHKDYADKRIAVPESIDKNISWVTGDGRTVAEPTALSFLEHEPLDFDKPPFPFLPPKD